MAAAETAGLPTLKDSKPSTDVDKLAEYAKDFEFPVFVKAVVSGGGRGMRFIENEEELKTKCAEASREAEAAFGDGHVYLETAVIKPQHIEVQILADSQGNVMHLSSVTAPCSAATRRSSRSLPPRPWIRSCVTASVPMP